VVPDPGSRASQDAEEGCSDLSSLFHQLNNQLGVILANAELLESRLTDPAQRARAGQLTASALGAIATVQQIRGAVGRQTGG
jgi:hypothetical protein